MKAPERRGLGLTLVEREIAYNLDGSAWIAFEAQGLEVSLEFDSGSAGHV